MGRKKPKPKGSVEHLKTLIGSRIKELRGEHSQESIAAASGVDRTIIGHIERGDTDYRIDSLLRVLEALKADSETTLFATDPLEQQLHAQVTRIYRAGVPSETHFIMEAMKRAETETTRVRASPPSKPQRSA